MARTMRLDHRCRPLFRRHGGDGRPSRAAKRPDMAAARQEANGIEIKVTAGFGENTGDVPEDLRAAILRLVAYWFENRGDEIPATRAARRRAAAAAVPGVAAVISRAGFAIA